jgi:prepilin-type N-terminal cleavage/methylation domain-containing protein
MMRNKGSRCRGQWVGEGGFTLIETIVTIAVLAIAAIGVLAVFSTGLQGSSNPLLVAQAAQLAQERMDTIVGDRLNSARGFNYIIPANYAADNPALGPITFNRTVAIYCVTAANLNQNTGLVAPCVSGYTHATVTVANAAIGSVSAETIFTNYN